ncbi:MAG TPA: branched-chain amino acid ABC transporter permease [Anaeromyxobacteraceae bacterium]|nr:branched-chain amino acid ABC transporter permease [Anaeromyxobacteraceae bacterium]
MSAPAPRETTRAKRVWSGQAVFLAWATVVAAGVVAPFVVYPVFAMNVLVMALFASALNLLLGYTGLLSFGHAAFLGSAAYVTGWAAKAWGTPVPVSIAAGVAMATVLGLVFGVLALRRTGIYFAMITLGLAQVIYFLVVQMPWTGGEDGLQGIPRGTFLGIDLGNSLAMYYFTYGVFLAAFWVIQRTIDSPFGQVLRAIKDNEPRAISLGYDVQRYKLLAFVISAALAGLAGSLKAISMQFATLGDVAWQRSGEVVLMTLLGGMGTVLGPSVGALLVVTMENYLAAIGSWVTVITGAVFVVTVMAARRGIVGEIRALLGRR